ncbi:MAG: hypothetical protein M3475_01275 [Actinomycetota bacterium]|nr:hypothetical protein [Actinomycetota bacterium]
MIEAAKGSGLPGARVARILLVASTVLLLASCEGVGRDPGAQDDINEGDMQELTSSGFPNPVSLDELTQRADRFYGKRVTVEGRVNRSISPQALSLTSEDASEGGGFAEVEAALVIEDEASFPEGISEGRSVRVTGVVGQLDVKEIEQNYNVNLDDSVYAEFEEKPVVYARILEVLAGSETTGE